jgi:hypothetical protein
VIDTTTMKRHANGSHVVAEHITEVIVIDLADVTRLSTEAGDSHHRIGRRPATHLNRSSQRSVKLDGTISFDQRHGPLGEVLSVKKLLRCMGNDIDERISNTDDGELRCSGT